MVDAADGSLRFANAGHPSPFHVRRVAGVVERLQQPGEKPGGRASAQMVGAAPRLGLKAADAKAIVRDVDAAVSGWRKVGRQLRIKASTLDAYASAFEHPHMEAARAV